MKLINELLELIEADFNDKKKKKKKKAEKPDIQNFVAKHAQTSGAGAHADKQGQHAGRQRQKRQWKKEEGLE